LDDDRLLDSDDALLMELDDSELDGGRLDEEPLLELGGAELEDNPDELDEAETLEEDALDALAELEAGGCGPMCGRCGFRFLCGCRRSCRRLSGLRSTCPSFLVRRRFMDDAMGTTEYTEYTEEETASPFRVFRVFRGRFLISDF